jgi:hypothetical protein
MKALLTLAFLASLSLLLFLTPALANHDTIGDSSGGCCRDGSSPWASQSKDAWQPNANAGYQGSELPPSSGFNPDRLNRYENPLYSPYPQTPQASQPIAPAYGTRDVRVDPSYDRCDGPLGAACGRGR